MNPNYLEMIKRMSALQKAAIASGEILVCNKERPMDPAVDWGKQKWFHEPAVMIKTISETNMNVTRLMHCPACGTSFPVVFRRLRQIHA